VLTDLMLSAQLLAAHAEKRWVLAGTATYAWAWMPILATAQAFLLGGALSHVRAEYVRVLRHLGSNGSDNVPDPAHDVAAGRRARAAITAALALSEDIEADTARQRRDGGGGGAAAPSPRALGGDGGTDVAGGSTSMGVTLQIEDSRRQLPRAHEAVAARNEGDRATVHLHASERAVSAAGSPRIHDAAVNALPSAEQGGPHAEQGIVRDPLDSGNASPNVR
jgi:hypothetical protein